MNNEQAILSRFQELRNEISQMGAKANEMAAESQEHELVLKALEPMEGTRKCYRVVGHLLIQSMLSSLICQALIPIAPSPHLMAVPPMAVPAMAPGWKAQTMPSQLLTLWGHMFHTTCSFVS